MDARKTISAVLGIQFPCASLVLKVIDLDNFTFFFNKIVDNNDSQNILKKLEKIV